DVDTLSGGVTEDNIRNIANYYYSKNQIAFMLIVGDNGDIPAANSNFNNPNLAGPSDISYAYITGNDHYPEFVVGRFSGETSVEIQNMVNRTLAYEKTPNTFGNWMTQQIGIASEEGTGDDGQYDYEHIHEIVDSNVNLGNYTYYYELYDGVQSKGWNDAPGFPTANDLKNLINSGASLINYTGHGGATGIVTTGFNISNVPTLNNSNKLPFFYVVGCSPGRFYNQTCFAEELMRAGNVNDAFGTISNFMSTIDQYWDEPMEAQDEFNGIMRGGRPNNLQSRLGAMCVNSCCAMNDKYNTWADPTGGSDMTDTWIFFGDPTVSLYNKNNGTITCTHTAEIGVNSTWYSVNCPVEGATVGLYYLGKYLASSKVTGGVATFTFPPIANLDTVFITVTKQNYTPYFGYTKVVTFPNNIKQLENDNILSVYPNPATEFTIIKSNEKPIQHIQLLDLKGSILFEETLNNQEYRLNTKLYPKGNYLLKIFTPNNSLLRKLRI
ncbi:MAG: C25 family cysteine peptidase, partial [Bacteroidia bacterium]|nr:C25 family cysteine peptidase [Bacteroidia bacterium]